MDHQDHIGPSARMDGAALLAKACDVLDAVAAQRDGIGQAELAARLGLPRTTLYRILAGLVARGLLRQDPARRVYSLGFRLLEMAQGVWSTPNLPAAAAPELRQLRDMTGETAYVAALEGRDVLSLGKYEGAHERRSAARLGERKPLHCTSQGKAILAFLPEAERDALLKRLPLKPMTPHTLTDRRRLAAALRIVRARGFATDDEEIALGTRCVGAPVLDGEGRVLGAVSIAGPAWRMTVERLELLGPEVAAAGR
ncbi:MAG: transcriptional regulator, IclR family, partial [Roseomonas sp.]|nr:transcriptional regulator, IclR family [Roseomonas sp.]